MSNSITKLQYWKQLGIDKRTEKSNYGIKYETQILAYKLMNTWFSKRELKVYNGRRIASLTKGVGITGCQPVEEWK